MVGFTTLALSALLSSLATSSPISSPSSLLPTKRQITCVPSSGLYILVARGSNQPEGEGSVGPVANLIEAQLAGSYSHAIDYPATIISWESNYFSSVEDGIEDTKKSIQEYVAACGEDARIALIGYSQGGNVMTDTLAGGTGKPEPIAESYRKNIVGVAVFADPRFNAGKAYSRGTSTEDGIFGRDSSAAALDTWADVLVSYCDADDLFCASGGSLDVHYAAVEKYSQQAADFIIGLAM
ncbi:carbohydrate esterase family 5 protein [Sphaerulina musiva SO2202]|uniref:Carbohydrate esterase family 5 protein n=1 Tax=Sphaerulina musiva (strain SO2202) TaxID=692275 RepID=M3DBF7_SPHMS|nr:carbohydrate esterase family 5 protein [Sphaerulina musiva SO2202]EMF15189.1 carbohydrate esterase family 5 protein [Sphaerulina musiva SO2202]